MSEPDMMAIATNKFSPEQLGRSYNKTFRFACEVHCENKNLSIADQVFLVDFVTFRDYEENFADVNEVNISFPVGTFMYDVWDSLDNVEITIKKITQFYSEEGPRSESKPIVDLRRYKAVFLSDKNKAIPSTRSASKSDLNQQLPLVVTFQLIDKAAEAVRIKTTGGSFSDGKNGVSPEQFLRNVLSHEVNKILVDGKAPVDVISVAKADNTEKLPRLLVPAYTRVVELTDYVQETMGGLYNDGAACYVQTVMPQFGEYKTVLAVFNLYNPDCEGTADSVIYCTNKSLEVNQYVGGYPDPSGKGVHLLAHRLSQIEDDKNTTALNTGTGFRVTDASKIMDAPVVYRPGGAVFDRNASSTEVVGEDRADGGNFAVNKGISHNNFALTSDVIRRSGKFATVQISNLDHSLIAPGKKYELCYLSSVTAEDGTVYKKTVRRYAYVLQMISAYTNSNPDLMMNANTTHVELTNHTTLKVIVGKILNPEVGEQ